MGEGHADFAATFPSNESALGTPELLKRVAQGLLGDCLGGTMSACGTDKLGITGRRHLDTWPMMRASFPR